MENTVSNDDLEIIKYIGLDVENYFNTGVIYNYISNPDGTVRWVYPKSTSYPSFLNFYSTSTLKAKLFNILIKLAFALKLRNYVKSGSLNLKIKKHSILDDILKANSWDGFSIFTGTKGLNRKIIVELNKKKETFLFVKIALNKNSRKLLQNEYTKIQFINKLGLDSVIAPEVNHYNVTKGYLALSNIKPKNDGQTTNFTLPHAITLREVLNNTLETHSLYELDFFKNIEKSIMEIRAQNKRQRKIGNFEFGNLFKGLENLYNDLDIESKCNTSVSHCDFTPWNIFLGEKELFVIDWELSEFKTPVFYDLFHFVFQSSILVKRDSYKLIVSKIDVALGHYPIKNILNQLNIDINKYYQFYILHVVSYYLNKYLKQDNLHEQVYWLLSVWEEAIKDLNIKKGITFNEK
jgi:thiamine kinase-like enzyme